MLSIARHTVLDYPRTRSRRPKIAALPDWVAVADGVQAGAGSQFDEQILLERLIAALDPDRREVFVITQILGLSYQDAAEVIGCPVGTVRSRLARARDDLVAALAAPQHGGTSARRHLRAV